MKVKKMEISKHWKKFHVSKNKDYNVQTPTHGNYFFPSFSDLFPPFLKAYPTYTPHNCTSFIFRPRKDINYPIYLDFDFKGREPTQLVTADLVKLAKKMVKRVGGSDFVLSRRESSYIKTTKKEQFHAFGFHLWIFGEYSLQQCKDLRDYVLKDQLLTPLRKKYNFYNSDENAVDPSPALRANGLFLIGDRKPGLECAPHFICYAKGKEREHGWQYTDPTLFCALLEQMYGFMFLPKGVPQILKTEPPIQVAAPGPDEEKTWVLTKESQFVAHTQTNFKLETFLEITKGHVADTREWKQLCVFFCSQGLDCRTTNDLCEKAWAPFRHTCNTPRRKNSTYQFMRKITRIDVTKASVVAYLNEWSVRAWTDEEVFGEPAKLLYNDYTFFTKDRKQIFKYSALVDYLKRTVEYVFTIKKFTWCYQTTVKDRNGSKVVLTHRTMSKDPPFSRNDDIAIKTYPPVATIVKFLEKQLPKKIDSEETVLLEKKLNQLIVKITELDAEQAFLAAKELGFSPLPQVTRFSVVLADLQLKTELNRYTEITFQPTSALVQNPCSGFDKHTLNTFNGFTLNKYSPSRTISVQNTKLWEYFREVFGYGSTSHVQFRFILNLLAFQLQFPAIRTGRITLIISKAEGTGKSFLFNILAMLLKGYTSFHDSLATYLQRFNISDHSKLAIWVDDIYGASLKETRRVFPKVTCTEQQYERKGESMLSLKEFSNLWITSNEKTPLHIKPTDRRQLLFRVSERKLRDRPFFKACAEECEDLDIAHAWFTFLKQRNILQFEPNSDPDACLKGETIASCMVKSHVFLRRFFLEDWYRAYRKEECPEDIWVRAFEVSRNKTNPNKDEIRLRISQKRLYKLYQYFIHDMYPQSRVRNSDTFFEELQELGIVRFTKRRDIKAYGVDKKKKHYVVDIYFKQFKEKMLELYPGIILTTWLHEEDYEQFERGLKHYMGLEFVD